MGIVHHSQYIVWMEEGRSDLMRRKGFTFDQWERVGIGFAVSELSCAITPRPVTANA